MATNLINFRDATSPPPTNMAQPIEERLLPSTALHRFLVGRLLERLRLSRQAVAQRYDDWNEVDEHVRLFIDLSRRAKRADRSRDSGKREMPFERAIVMPISYAILMTRLTALMRLYFARRPFIQIKGRGPEDIVPAKLMEAVLDYDFLQMRAPLVVYGATQDSEKYGIGIIHDGWDNEYDWTWEDVLPEQLRSPEMQNFFASQGLSTRIQKWDVVRQYNNWQAVDPFRWRPDPRVPGADIQQGEFAGHLAARSWTHLLSRSRDNGGPYFNLQFLRAPSSQRQAGRNLIGRMGNEGTSREVVHSVERQSHLDRTDRGMYTLAQMQVKVIPREWGLSDETTPHIWWFTMVDEQTIIRAHPNPHMHGKFTYSPMQSNFDPHTCFVPGMLENIDPLQRLADWLYASQIENTRRGINNQLLYGPSWIEEQDLLNPGPALHLRLSELGEKLVEQGRISPQMVVQQLPLTNYTEGFFDMAQQLFNLAQVLAGTNDPAMGQPTATKRTLGEIERILATSSARIALTGQVNDMLCFTPLAERAIANRQQFTTMEQYFQIQGALAQQVGMERLLIAREQLQGNFDYIPLAAANPPDPQRSAEIWERMLETSMASQLDPPEVIHAIRREIAMNLGVRNFDDIVPPPQPQPPPEMEVQDDAEVQQQVQAGNMVPLDQAGAIPPESQIFPVGVDLQGAAA